MLWKYSRREIETFKIEIVAAGADQSRSSMCDKNRRDCNSPLVTNVEVTFTLE